MCAASGYSGKTRVLMILFPFRVIDSDQPQGYAARGDRFIEMA